MSLYQHQVAGAKWLAARARGYLGDRPGLGKTRTLIAALNAARVTQPLIVCPAIVRTHWRREFEACQWGRPPIIKSYDEIVRGGDALMAQLIGREKIDSLVTDEAHYLKHATSKRTVQLLGRNGYARRLPRVYCASGTPVPKNPAELWTTLASLFPEVAIEHGLRTRDDFLARFCTVTGRMVRGRWTERVEPVVRNEAEFKQLLAKVMLARTLDDVGLDVPGLDWQITRLDGGGFTTDQDGWDVAHALAHDESLADIANDPHIARMRRRLGELKIEPTRQLIGELLDESDEKVVVFAHHRIVLQGLHANLAGHGVAYIDGDVPDSERAARIDRFQTDPECRVFLGQNIACQTGITLTAARRVFLVEPDWTAVVNDQLGHRVARIGQTAERCIAHMIALAGTLDEAIINQNHREVRMAASIGLGE